MARDFTGWTQNNVALYKQLVSAHDTGEPPAFSDLIMAYVSPEVSHDLMLSPIAYGEDFTREMLEGFARPGLPKDDCGLAKDDCFEPAFMSPYEGAMQLSDRGVVRVIGSKDLGLGMLAAFVDAIFAVHRFGAERSEGDDTVLADERLTVFLVASNMSDAERRHLVELKPFRLRGVAHRFRHMSVVNMRALYDFVRTRVGARDTVLMHALNDCFLASTEPSSLSHEPEPKRAATFTSSASETPSASVEVNPRREQSSLRALATLVEFLIKHNGKKRYATENELAEAIDAAFPDREGCTPSNLAKQFKTAREYVAADGDRKRKSSLE